MFQTALIVLLIVAALPWVVYLSVKLGTYAFFKGRNLFEVEHKELSDGEK